MENKFIIIDDELHHLEFLIDFLKHLHIKFDTAENADLGLQLINNNTEYTGYIIDLNIPTPNHVLHEAIHSHEETLYREYPGFFLAQEIRNKGISGKKVIIYSVHVEDSIYKVAQDRLDIIFIPKGKPKILKKEIEKLISKQA